MTQPHNSVVGTRFTTQAPSLATERANATPLFAVYRELVNCVAVWGGGRLRSDEGPTVATAAQQRRSSAPTTPPDGDSRRHVLVDEALGNASSNTDETQTTQTRDGPRRRDAVAMTSLVRGNDGVCEAAPTPSWIEAEMEAFFDVALARAIQERETNLVNVMHECFQQQLGEQHRALDTQRQLTTSLSAQVQSYEKEMTHMQSKIDRRVAENNALRKDFYKQLLMLRELVNKHKSDPRTLRALDEVITTVTLGKEKAAAFAAEAANSNHGKRSADTRDQDGLRGDGSGVSQSNSLTVRREKEKWEERAREAMMECQQLQEQVLLLRQQIDEGGSEGSHWFSSAQFGLGERQRIIDAVYKGKCSWENVGDAVVELLNNDMIWEAVEDSAYREKTRVSRGFEAMLLRAEVSSEAVDDLDLDPDVDGVGGSSRRTLNRRRSAFSLGGRLVLCRSCNGCGYIDATAMQNGDDLPEENDSYLRKTLAQVLELKTALEKANQQTVQAEDALRKVVMEGSSIKERLERIEFIKAHGVDSGLQTDLDAEEEIDIDEIMSTYSSGESSGSGAMGSSRLARRNDGRWKQYEHLIVELKNSVTERDTGLAELRSTLSNFQSKLVAVQKESQQVQVRHQQEVQTLKASLALAMKSRNDAIEEKQAAMKVMLKKMNTKSSKLSAALFSAKKVTESDASSDDDTQSQKSNNSSDNTDDVAKDECDDEADEVKRSELIARRYSDAISRVQQEHDEQQRALKQTEEQLTEETDKRKRTNSIMLGNIAVTMTSHPRDLFKALSTAHNELTSLRRSSQRSSALQTDRLLTLTTHLAHISEELCMVRKRTNTEIEYWQLECEKLHNTNKMVTIDLHKARDQLQGARDKNVAAVASKPSGACGICEKHQARLLAISSNLLAATPAAPDTPSDGRSTPQGASSESETSVAVNKRAGSVLSKEDRNDLGAILLELEELYSTFNSGKQQEARSLLTRALITHTQYIAEPDPQHDGLLSASTGRRTSLQSHGTETQRAGLFISDIASDRRSDSAIAGLSDRSLSSIIEDHDDCSDPNEAGERRRTQRLFNFSVFDESRLANRYEPTSDLLLQGSTIALHAPSGATGLPSHHRKKIVCKILSEQEVLQRQRARYSRSFSPPGSSALSNGASSFESYNPEIAENDDWAGYSTYVDDNGQVVHFVEVEIDDDPQSSQEMSLNPSAVPTTTDAIIANTTSAGYSGPHSSNQSERRSDLNIQIPQPMPLDTEDSPNQQETQLTTVARPTHSADIDRDPQVIAQLRDLLNHISTTRQALALTNWRILLSHLRAQREERRLDYINHQFKQAVATGKLGSSQSLPTSVRCTMQKLVQTRELALDTAIQDRDSLRRNVRRAQAHLIHGVSSILTTLSLKANGRIQVPEAPYIIYTDPQRSPPRNPPSPVYRGRPIYPTTPINLSEIPDTQQVPTPSFPFNPADGSRENVLYQKTPPVSALSSPTKSFVSSTLVSSTLAVNNQLPSLFENDNRFPQRATTFVPVGESEEKSLTHSTSTILHPSRSPASSPSKSSILLDARRRPTRSAGPNRPESVGTDGIADVTLRSTMDKEYHVFERPTRPQSSPAGMSSRMAPHRVPDAIRYTRESEQTTELRRPEYTNS